ncbi:CzcE family metal-binding protein [Cupriavidus gilardii]|uniref:CzcE family metal-binding protein n=1 Tax=Cupriavidus TaxID=106589 RepID=UPI00165B4D1F|nr:MULTISPECIES: CzcE family metal-binding protein [Cupriavidus]MCA7082503.1 CzcE family metal-binding protein [Cupriavidus sp. DB3]MCT9119133.1 CzcE family metal-binding protein [Cupriavidus gilardii]MCT9124967.1 CzcE family metal-binding protein [Cupriavidus gilardii]UXC34540.1 CzcE family metal-binding protein [Cupriavidus gilardii]
MKTKTTALAALSLFVLLSTSSAWSVDKARTNAGDDWAEHVQRQASSQTPAATSAQQVVRGAATTTALGPHAMLFGSPASPNTASRVVTLTPGLKSVNVASGDTVTFKSGTQELAWAFAEFVHGSTVDLADLFPALPNAKGVRIYIERSRVFIGG